MSLSSDKIDVDPVRRRIMKAVGQKDTKPEMIVRQTLHALGYRFRLHRRDLPGSPDIVLPRYRTVIFVHGCFWHRHEGCARATVPKTRQAFWSDKFKANKVRDRRALVALQDLGWNAQVIWECQTRSVCELETALNQVLRQTQHEVDASTPTSH